MNKIILLGRLTKDPEYKTMPSGAGVTNFTVAVNRNFKNKEGNYDADFLPCVAYRNTAEFINKYFKKGSLICLEGRVQVRNYDAQDGSKRYVTEVIVQNVEFVGGKNDSSDKTNDYYPDIIDEEINEVDVSNSDPFEDNDSDVILSDDDLPF